MTRKARIENPVENQHGVESSEAQLRKEISSSLGLEPSAITGSVLKKVATDPLYLHHLNTCRGDADFLSLLLKEGNQTETDTVEEHTNVELLKSLVYTMTKWAKSGFEKVSEEILKKRLDTCASCPNADSVSPDKFLYRVLGSRNRDIKICKLCGCAISKKARLATETCPDETYGSHGRWVWESI